MSVLTAGTLAVTDAAGIDFDVTIGQIGGFGSPRCYVYSP